MESGESDLRDLFLIFYEVLRFCEGFYISSDIYTLFKSAKLLEDTYIKLESIGSLNEFENKLNEFWAIKGLTNIPLKFFEKVSHEVLTKLLTDSNYNNDTVKLGVSQFLTMNSEQHFHDLVKKLNDTTKSVEILKQSCTNISDYNATSNLEELSKYLADNDDSVEEAISLVTSIVLEDTDSFKKILRALCNINVKLLCPDLNKIADVMSMPLSNPEHINLYKNICELNDKDFCTIVTSWDSILDSFLKMIEYSISKLKSSYLNRSHLWINPGTEKSLSFQDITILINKLKLTPNIYAQLQVRLSQLKENGYAVVVEDIQRACRIK